MSDQSTPHTTTDNVKQINPADNGDTTDSSCSWTYNDSLITKLVIRVNDTFGLEYIRFDLADGSNKTCEGLTGSSSNSGQ